MRFSVLGPLSVTGEDGGQLVLAGIKPRLVLARLLLARNRPVPLVELIELLWGDRPPRSARANAYSYLTKVKRWVGADRLDHSLSGYTLTLAPGELDLDSFILLRAKGTDLRNSGDAAGAARHWQAALALWHGEPLGGIAADHLAGQVAELNELRMTTVEDFLDVEITLGHAGELTAELHRLVTEHPLRERLHGSYIRALYAAGRQADALQAFQAARTILIEELAVEPGPQLRRLHLAVLGGDLTALELPRSDITTSQETFSAVCQLPADAADFVGRDELLGELEARLRRRRRLEVLALCGMPGSGKTALAVRLAHRVRELFPDGQLFVALTEPSGIDRAPFDVLAELLRSLGVPTHAIPTSLDERAAAFRARTADRKILLVLDDAAGEPQVRPLLPGTAECAVVLTSRRQLVGLAGARPVRVGVLNPEDACRMFTSAVGPHRIAAGDRAVARVADLCGGLPLALRLAAARLVARPDWTPGELADQLSLSDRRLDLLRAGDLAVRASFDRGYRDLPEFARLVLRRFAYAEVPHLPSWAVYALVGDGYGATMADVDQALDQLVTASLLLPDGIDCAGQHRFRIHELLRIYANERAAAEEHEADAGQKAVLRLMHESTYRESTIALRFEHPEVGVPTQATGSG